MDILSLKFLSCFHSRFAETDAPDESERFAKGTRAIYVGSKHYAWPCVITNKQVCGGGVAFSVFVLFE